MQILQKLSEFIDKFLLLQKGVYSRSVPKRQDLNSALGQTGFLKRPADDLREEEVSFCRVRAFCVCSVCEGVAAFTFCLVAFIVEFLRFADIGYPHLCFSNWAQLDLSYILNGELICLPL